MKIKKQKKRYLLYLFLCKQNAQYAAFRSSLIFNFKPPSKLNIPLWKHSPLSESESSRVLFRGSKMRYSTLTHHSSTSAISYEHQTSNLLYTDFNIYTHILSMLPCRMCGLFYKKIEVKVLNERYVVFESCCVSKHIGLARSLTCKLKVYGVR